ncbi:uncharacterized protein LOC103520351 [Diaphorina citri]|uniref:Uncharacterized protein LOC103520351 n=1 Tax=Diaphorina citri TaxID=121845 RepID=A0A1S4EPH7_DIACI|nr:uncharacterized protein LOC103520351 [Diaphorina citri]
MRYQILKEEGKKTFKLQLKPGVFPTKFACQPDRKRTHTVDVLKSERASLLAKKEDIKRRKLVKDLLEAGPSNQTSLPCEQILEDVEIPLAIDDDLVGIHMDINIDDEDIPSVLHAQDEQVKMDCKETQTEVLQRTVGMQSKKCCYPKTSKSVTDSESLVSEVTWEPQDTSFHIEDCESVSTDSVDFEQERRQKEEIRMLNMQIMEQHSKRYLGLDRFNMFLIEKLMEITKFPKLDFFITLRKLKLHESIDILADTFGLSKSSISRIFSKVLPVLGKYLETLIYWPPREIIRTNLPLAFRANFVYVQSIINCFEIEIEKPSKPSHQSQTFSAYKNCNTVKYLISCTPDGFINFVSKGLYLYLAKLLPPFSNVVFVVPGPSVGCVL